MGNTILAALLISLPTLIVAQEIPAKPEQEILMHSVFNISLSMTGEEALEILDASGFHAAYKHPPSVKPTSWKYIKGGTAIQFTKRLYGEQLKMIHVTETADSGSAFDVVARTTKISASWDHEPKIGQQEIQPICQARSGVNGSSMTVGECLINSLDSETTGFYATLNAGQIMQRLVRFEPLKN